MKGTLRVGLSFAAAVGMLLGCHDHREMLSTVTNTFTVVGTPSAPEPEHTVVPGEEFEWKLGDRSDNNIYYVHFSKDKFCTSESPRLDNNFPITAKTPGRCKVGQVYEHVVYIIDRNATPPPSPFSPTGPSPTFNVHCPGCTLYNPPPGS